MRKCERNVIIRNNVYVMSDITRITAFEATNMNLVLLRGQVFSDIVSTRSNTSELAFIVYHSGGKRK